MIGHPTVRAWYDRHDVPPGRARLDADVTDLLERISPGDTAVDLGGTDNLILRLVDAELVLRVRKPFVRPLRMRATQALRAALAAHGVGVPVPQEWQGQSVLRCGARWAELDRFEPGLQTADDPLWRFAALGQLHRALRAQSRDLPRPLIRTLAAPSTLARWLVINRAAGHPELAAPGRAEQLAALLRALRRQWVPANRLPQQLIHHDPHADNLRRRPDGTAFYVDFDGVAAGPRAHDVAYALAHWLHAQGSTPIDWSTLVAAYDRAAGVPLSTVEHQALRPYAAAVGLYYQICDWGEGPWWTLSQRLLAPPS